MPHFETTGQDKDDLTHKMILVVEDDDSIGRLLVDTLIQETSYQAMLVTDGLQALQTAQAIKPCLFITDYRLPSINGIELYDRLHATEDLANTPIILMSAYLPEEEVKKRSLTSLNKPFELDDLLDKIEQLLSCS